MKYWLFKSEPGAYSIDDLKKDKQTEWDGIRNYQARNFLREVKKGDLVLFYHSNAKPPHVAGVARAVREAYPDPTQFAKGKRGFDPKSTKEAPRWFMVDVEFVEKLPEPVPIATIKAEARFENMKLVQTSRLSVQPVGKTHFRQLLEMGLARTKA